jgi:mono/diheme cytochrome c family protein
MLNFIESNAGRIATRIQSIGAGFDPEVLALPGGSIIALLLWAYSGVAVSLNRSAARPKAPLPAIGLAEPPVVACAGCHGRQ